MKHFCTLAAFQIHYNSKSLRAKELNWNPHSLLQINPNPTPLPSTQLTLVYNTYVYPPREEERDSKMGGFKLGVFYREARINRSTGELLLYDWSSTKSRLDPDSIPLPGPHVTS